MTTVTVPLASDLLEAIDRLVERGIAANKADAIRKALREYIEAQEIADVIAASKEPRLSGDIDELANLLS